MRNRLRLVGGEERTLDSRLLCERELPAGLEVWAVGIAAFMGVLSLNVTTVVVNPPLRQTAFKLL